MIKYFLLIFLTLCISKYLNAQTQYIDDLDKEFRYKAEGIDLEDRGLNLFKQDLEIELNKSPLFKKNTKAFEKVNFMVNFNDKIVIDHLGIYDINRNVVVENRSQKEDILAEILDKFKSYWKPAEHQGEIYKDKQGWVSFNIHCNDNGDITINGINFSPSKERFKLDSSCFKIIAPISKYENPFFYSTENKAFYRGGVKMLISNLNAFQKPTKTKNTTIDYFTIDFVITRAKELAFFNNYNPTDKVEALVSNNLKLLSCNWLPAHQSGRPVNLVLSYKFYYSYTLDYNQQRNNINILDVITEDVPLKTKIERNF